MKADKFIIPNSLGIWRYRQREGPPISYIVWKDNSTRGFSDKKSLLKFVNWSKTLPTGQALREWLEQFDDEAVVAKPLDEFHQQIAVEGFGPEAFEGEPNSNTKMIT